jgi:hypothetical protein
MIDYNIIGDSIVFYEGLGYKRIESPWTVSEYVDNLTKPDDKISFQLKHNNKCLVASGEQSFLYLYLKGFLPKGQFQTTTPCFRNESFDFSHTKYFIKNELIKTDSVHHNDLLMVTESAYKFFKKYIPDTCLDVVVTGDGFDIEYKGYELGSYGIRENEFLKWVYGTGCAEPRFSKIVNLYKNGISQQKH